jgi:hypothetical protein
MLISPVKERGIYKEAQGQCLSNKFHFIKIRLWSIILINSLTQRRLTRQQ